MGNEENRKLAEEILGSEHRVIRPNPGVLIDEDGDYYYQVGGKNAKLIISDDGTFLLDDSGTPVNKMIAEFKKGKRTA